MDPRTRNLMIVGGIVAAAALVALVAGAAVLVAALSSQPTSPTQGAKPLAPKTSAPTATPADTATAVGGLVCVVIGIAVAFVAGLAVWMLPIVIAVFRKHPSIAAIAVVTALLGWTLVGYAVALAWSCAAIDADKNYR